MSDYKVEVVSDIAKTELGEGPHWDAERETLFYVDLMGYAVGAYHPDSGKSTRVNIEGECLGQKAVSLVVPVAGRPTEFVIGHGRSLKRLEWDTVSDTVTALNTIYDSDDPKNLEGRFNDGKCDTNGRLWAGTMPIFSETPAAEDYTKGSIFKLDGSGTATAEWQNVGISNGIAWSPDNRTFYYVDSYVPRVDAWDYDADTGKITNRRPVFDYTLENETGEPDGMAADVDGNLWVACFGSSKVLKISPVTGKVLGRVELPTKLITSVAFGGKNLDELYVTSCKCHLTPEEQEAQPDAGAIFKVTNLGTRGLSAGIPYTSNI